MEQAILDACGGTLLEEVESLTLDSNAKARPWWAWRSASSWRS